MAQSQGIVISDNRSWPDQPEQRARQEGVLRQGSIGLDSFKSVVGAKWPAVGMKCRCRFVFDCSDCQAEQAPNEPCLRGHRPAGRPRPQPPFRRGAIPRTDGFAPSATPSASPGEPRRRAIPVRVARRLAHRAGRRPRVCQENVTAGQPEVSVAPEMVPSQEARALWVPGVCLGGGYGWTETTCPLPSHRRWGRCSWRR